MPFLLLVSLIWAFSFSFLKRFLGGVPPDVVNAIRLGITALVFLPFLGGWAAERRASLRLMGVGALQLGAMCFCYTRAYGSLQAHEAALATVMTPLYIVLIQGWLERRFRLASLGCALLSVAGTAICLGWGSGMRPGVLGGLVLVQASNLCFAAGQVLFRRLMAGLPGWSSARGFAWCALGGAVLALLAALPVLAVHGLPRLDLHQGMALVYLGAIASGLGFFLWNVGARRVNTTFLAVMNDLKIPLAILVALLVFRERVHGGRLALGGSLVVLAGWLGGRLG
nr:EamA family transporter [uncultured Holophaga sp.]